MPENSDNAEWSWECPNCRLYNDVREFALQCELCGFQNVDQKMQERFAEEQRRREEAERKAIEEKKRIAAEKAMKMKEMDAKGLLDIYRPNPQMCGPNVNVQNEFEVVTTFDEMKFPYCIGKKPFPSSGIYRWRVDIVSGQWAYCGVATTAGDRKKWLGGDQHSWSIYPRNNRSHTAGCHGDLKLPRYNNATRYDFAPAVGQGGHLHFKLNQKLHTLECTVAAPNTDFDPVGVHATNTMVFNNLPSSGLYMGMGCGPNTRLRATPEFLTAAQEEAEAKRSVTVINRLPSESGDYGTLDANSSKVFLVTCRVPDGHPAVVAISFRLKTSTAFTFQYHVRGWTDSTNKWSGPVLYSSPDMNAPQHSDRRTYTHQLPAPVNLQCGQIYSFYILAIRGKTNTGKYPGGDGSKGLYSRDTSANASFSSLGGGVPCYRIDFASC